MKGSQAEVRTKVKKQFSEVQDASNIAVYLDDQPELFKDPQALINYKINGVKVVKANKNESAALPHIQMYDLKLNVFGPTED